MGQDATATLFYGFCWDEPCRVFAVPPDVPDADDYPEWPEIIARKRGHINPWDDYPGSSHLPYEQQRAFTNQWCADNDAALNAWREATARIEKEFGCDIGRYGYGGGDTHPTVYVALSVLRADWDRGKALPALPVARPEWNEMLARFGEELDIVWPQPSPQWWLTAFYG